MPTYEYKCKECGNEFEYFQSMKEEPLSVCLCEKKGKVERLISMGSGIIFKGSGFYVTDYKKQSNGSNSSQNKNSESSSSGSDTSKKETSSVAQSN